MRTVNDDSKSFSQIGKMELAVTEMGKTADGVGIEGRSGIPCWP